MTLGFKVFYNGKSVDVLADSSYQAQQVAAKVFKVPEKKQHMISVVATRRVLLYRDGEFKEAIQHPEGYLLRDLPSGDGEWFNPVMAKGFQGIYADADDRLWYDQEFFGGTERK